MNCQYVHSLFSNLDNPLASQTTVQSIRGVGGAARGNVHGGEWVLKSKATWNGGPRWGDNLELSQSYVVIAQEAMPLTSSLRLDPPFQVAYQHDIAVVFTKLAQ